ncbi:MAG TPA: endonuclease/exonuclease/phosphatase family protein [Candidatus Hydrogenedentes bacterium]|nr:endonuclease/exonuclease/phosphatase family protein [Candidatus Hydrogenedentota bacterium]HPG65899.1 endonuclease/exonuclease/phosphatase family protein [Candidatus Hydrogenedentota bacterium]
MHRRTFFRNTVALAALTMAGKGTAESAEALRITETVPRLERVSIERRLELAANPEGVAPAVLNERVPEFNVIELDNGISAALPGETIRVVAWNMERGRHWRQGVTLLREHPALSKADVILLTEMDIGMARSGNEHTTRETALALDMNYAYAVEYLELPGVGSGNDDSSCKRDAWGYHGNAILSRFPLHDVRALRFPGIEVWYGSEQNRLGGRNAVMAAIDLGGAPLILVSTHLESSLLQSAARLLEGQLILRELDTHAAGLPVILGGDYNAMKTESVVRTFRDAGFLIDECNDLQTPTLQFRREGKARLGGPHIDYLIVRGLDVIASDTSPAVVPAIHPPTPDGTLLSDHAIVTVLVKAGHPS